MCDLVTNLVCVVNCYINLFIGKNVSTKVFIPVQTGTDHHFLECMLQKLLWKMRLKFQKYAITKRINQFEIQVWYDIFYNRHKFSYISKQ